MTRKNWALFLSLVVIVAFLPSAPRAEGPAMWRLDTLSTTIYFLGSFHILPPDTDWRDERIEEAMSAADTVVFEIDEAEMQRPDAVMLMQRQALLPAGQQLADLIAPATYARVEALAPQVDLPMALLDRFKPWYAGLMLTAGYMVKSGFSPELGVESVLQGQSKASGKRLLAFETLEQQLAALDTLSTADPDAVLLDTMRYLDDDSDVLDEIVESWRTGNTDALETLLVEDIGGYEQAYTALITDRNRAWVARMDDFMAEGGTYFIIVGAAHLVGDDSVIAMLAEKGLVAERY
ncbi:MAG: TraB/GumN family protein [Alphaproteobacteria bacterium]